MHHFVVAKKDNDAVEQVLRYSSPPPRLVFDAWAGQGFRLVQIAGPREGLRSREIIEAPEEWRVLEDKVVKR